MSIAEDTESVEEVVVDDLSNIQQELEVSRKNKRRVNDDNDDDDNDIPSIHQHFMLEFKITNIRNNLMCVLTSQSQKATKEKHQF